MHRYLLIFRTFAGLAITVAMLFFAIPTQASASVCCGDPDPYPETPFKLVAPDGDTSTWGDAIFYNRSVRVQGQIDGVDPDQPRTCHYVKAVADGGARGYSDSFCNQSGGFSIDLPADFTGGADYVYIYFYYSDSTTSYAVSYGKYYR